ncbi:GIY-YIG nuclease family protein [Blautia pseudococcoides]|uniref:GIY-YIG nuclease family protein n=1 Tax=Blautia pseudococcoides TaxID=1796616 RepID=UPI00148B11DA|nr:GIY-YIG nuclease family protein [Blautia pseudococcoides]QJU17551.1 GIY-YIG nuclease family protein [Blautia pseudococcoides]
MTAQGKSINLFLMDGDANGRIKCTLANWTGVAYKIPRTELDKCKERNDLKQSGVYLLFGTSDQTGKNIAYIGQAGARKNGDGILNRLLEHRRNPEKDYWTEAIVFTTSNNSFGPTEISYLENRFCNLALEAQRYEIKNGNDPSSGNITEEKESELEEFVDYAKLVMGTLGHKIFVPYNISPSNSNETTVTVKNDTTLYLKRTIKNVGIVEATGKQTPEGFIVLQGSHISPTDDDTIPAILKSQRKRATLDSNHVLQENMLFSSPSYAAMFVIGKSANGLTSWKTAKGITLKVLEQTNI